MDESRHSGHQDFEWATRLNRVSLQLLGLWPRSEKTPRERLKCDLRAFAVCLMLVVGFLIPFVQSLMRIRRNIMQVIEHLQFMLPVITCIVRIVILRWKKEAVIPVVNMIAEDWVESKGAHEKGAMITWARRARVVTIIGYSVMSVSFVCVVLLPSLGTSITYDVSASVDTNRLLPLQAYHIYNLTARPLYELTYISHFVLVLICLVTYTGVDNFLGLLVFHICGQLDILRARLVRLDRLMSFRDSLRSCVLRHERLLRAIDVIEDTYNVMLLALFLYFGISFAFYGFLILNIFDENSVVSIARLPFLISNLVNIFVHMALYCAVGEILVAQCDRIHYAIYDQEWYTLHPNEMKDLILLMVRSKVPSYITAGRVFPLTMVTFSNLVKTSAGYISVLYTTKR